MRAEVRFLAWLGGAAALSLMTAPSFLELLGRSLGDTFGSVFPAIPFAALLTLIFALRWRDLRATLEKEGGPLTQMPTRALGGAVLVALLSLASVTGESVVTSGIAVIMTFYAFSLVVNPLTRLFLLPYAGVYAAGVGAPFALQWAFGSPLAVFSSDLSARLVGLIGFPVAWEGTQFQLLSKTGDVINGVVTPGCSSVISVTTFLGLLALMHVDLRKDLRSTLTLAAAGVLTLIALNEVRILTLMWVGYDEGASAFWGAHNWIGYALFLGFYLSVLPVYTRMGRTRNAAYPTVPGMPCASS